MDKNFNKTEEFLKNIGEAAGVGKKLTEGETPEIVYTEKDLEEAERNLGLVGERGGRIIKKRIEEIKKFLSKKA